MLVKCYGWKGDAEKTRPGAADVGGMALGQEGQYLWAPAGIRFLQTSSPGLWAALWEQADRSEGIASIASGFIDVTLLRVEEWQGTGCQRGLKTCRGKKEGEESPQAAPCPVPSAGGSEGCSAGQGSGVVQTFPDQVLFAKKA